MRKDVIEVPGDIKFLSDWEDFRLLDFPYILDKQITGCGFTEYCITSNENIILCSPRIILLENKEDNHKDEVLYLRNTLSESEDQVDFEKDLTKVHKAKFDKVLTKEQKAILDKQRSENVSNLKHQVREYFMMCQFKSKPTKILVTYDSYRLVYEALTELGVFDSFHTVVDEFQSIFTDSRFKSDTELGFVGLLKKIQKVCFVSATPMIEKYLDMLDDFKDLPMICLDWGALNPLRLSKPDLSSHPCQRINETAVSIINKYLMGDFESVIVEDEEGNLTKVVSDQAVIYVNSVKNICDIIRKAGLTYENTNVLCSRTPDNSRRIRKAFGLKRGQEGGIGKVPKKGEQHKMFTLCTRTVYLGADFYSPCARSFIFSDANIECLAVDITLDLPQIMGRQRLLSNPWRNKAELYVKILCSENKRNFEEFKNFQEEKIKNTNNLLLSYDSSPTLDSKHTLAMVYQDRAKDRNYKADYTSVNTHGGSDMIPVFNNLVMVSELRAFEIQQIDYADRFYVRNAIENEGFTVTDGDGSEVDRFFYNFERLTNFVDRLKYLCENTPKSILDIVLSKIPADMRTMYITLGSERLKGLGYQGSKIKSEMTKLLSEKDGTLKNILQLNFHIGDKYLRSEVKDILTSLYKENGISRAPKASDLENYFEIRTYQTKNKLTGKRDHGFEILGIKEDNGK